MDGRPPVVFPAGDVADRALGDAKAIGDLKLGFRSEPSSDGLGLLVGEMTSRAKEVLWLSAVGDAISQIIRLRLPRQVTRIDAAEVAIPAAMCGTMGRRGRISVHKPTHESVGVSAPAFMSEPPAAVLVEEVRPGETPFIVRVIAMR
jgi:hypothetical protein